MAKAAAWAQGRYIDVEVCCGELARAAESGTDGEGYGSLLDVRPDGSWDFNSSATGAGFCPWCGAPQRKEPK